MRQYFSTIALLTILTGCSTVSKTNHLEPGMSPKEVKKMFGSPAQTQMIANKKVMKYNLFQWFHGRVPYYMVFGKETDQLEEWFAHDEELQIKQKQWIEQAPPTQKSDINLKVQ